MSETEHKNSDLNRTPGDYAVTTGRALLSLVPGLGGPLVELAALLTPPLERRKETILLQLVEDIDAVKAHGVDVQRLFEDEAFLSTLLQVLDASVKTHHEGKRRALRNAMLNTALGKAPDEDLRHMFVNYVVELTESHLLILMRFKDSVKNAKPILGNGVFTPTEEAYPQFAGRYAFILQITRQLKEKGLLEWDCLRSGEHIVQETGYTLPLGDEFIKFITAPDDLTA
jgi:hypothetical protein